MKSLTSLFTFPRLSAPILGVLAVACGGSNDPQVVIIQEDGGPEVAADVAAEASPDAGGIDPGAPPKCEGAPPGGTAPAPRGDSAGALDTAGKQLLVFGGDTDVAPCGGVPTHTHVSDTWLLDVGCGTFRQLEGTGPSARARHAITEDRTAVGAGKALLFGGRTRPAGSTAAYTLMNDVWSFDFATSQWSEIPTTGGKPSARYNTGIAVSSKRKMLYVFGGSVSTSGLSFTPRADTFALDLTTNAWRGVGDPAALRPQPRLFHAVALDDDAGVLYVHAGADENAFTGPFFDDLWALDLETETWKSVFTSGDVPRGRISHHMAFDRTTKQLVVFGGHDDGDVGNQNDVWTIDPRATNPTWKKLPLGDAFNKKGAGACDFPPDFTTIDKLSPERRQAYVFGARPDGHGFVVYGGKSDCGLVADAWWFSGGASTWTPMLKSPVGLSCLRYSTTCSGLCG
jgi:N-acetylneuraminic acid mutarotase